jgi:hypothetical protein
MIDAQLIISKYKKEYYEEKKKKALYRDEDKVLYLKVLVKLIIRQYEFNL